MTRSSYQKQFKGFSLMELLLVLLVVAILLLVGFDQYDRYKRKQNVVAVQENVRLLFDAAMRFYYDQCLLTDSQNPLDLPERFKRDNFNIDAMHAKFPIKLNRSNLVNVDAQSNPPEHIYIKQGYSIYAEKNADETYIPDNQNPVVILYHYRLLVELVLSAKAQKDIEWYKTALRATDTEVDSDNNRLLVWKRLPGLTGKKTGEALWVAESGLSKFRRLAIEKLVAAGKLQGKQCAY